MFKLFFYKKKRKKLVYFWTSSLRLKRFYEVSHYKYAIVFVRRDYVIYGKTKRVILLMNFIWIGAWKMSSLTRCIQHFIIIVSVYGKHAFMHILVICIFCVHLIYWHKALAFYFCSHLFKVMNESQNKYHLVYPTKVMTRAFRKLMELLIEPETYKLG